jgi:hypothetical protein
VFKIRLSEKDCIIWMNSCDFVFESVAYSVSDPHRFYADPDPAFLLNADPDPTCRI